jgi:hypothetical protein
MTPWLLLVGGVSYLLGFGTAALMVWLVAHYGEEPSEFD